MGSKERIKATSNEMDVQHETKKQKEIYGYEQRGKRMNGSHTLRVKIGSTSADLKSEKNIAENKLKTLNIKDKLQ